jgi:acyl-CoA reductase-like NAD-dependent aldehyde dehydrogenase
MYNIKLLIDNEDASATHGRSFERKNPVTGEVATVAAAASPTDAHRAADAAAAAFPAWSAMGPNARRAVLLKAAEIMDAKGEEFGRRVVAETGSTAM